jgi:hypothetical protein
MNTEDWIQELADLAASDLLANFSVDDLEAGCHDADRELAERAITMADAIALEDTAMPMSDAISAIPGGWQLWGTPPAEIGIEGLTRGIG